LVVVGVDSERSRDFIKDVVERERDRKGASRSAVIGVDGGILHRRMSAGGVVGHEGSKGGGDRNNDGVDGGKEGEYVGGRR